MTIEFESGETVICILGTDFRYTSNQPFVRGHEYVVMEMESPDEREAGYPVSVYFDSNANGHYDGWYAACFARTAEAMDCEAAMRAAYEARDRN